MQEYKGKRFGLKKIIPAALLSLFLAVCYTSTGKKYFYWHFTDNNKDGTFEHYTTEFREIYKHVKTGKEKHIAITTYSGPLGREMTKEELLDIYPPHEGDITKFGGEPEIHW